MHSALFSEDLTGIIRINKRLTINTKSLQYVEQTKNMQCYHESCIVSSKSNSLQFVKYLIKLLGQCPSTLLIHARYDESIQHSHLTDQNKTLCQDCISLLLLYSNQFWSFDYVRAFRLESYDPIPPFQTDEDPQLINDMYHSIKNISEITYHTFRVPSICKQFTQHKQLFIAAFRHCFYLYRISVHLRSRSDTEIWIETMSNKIKNPDLADFPDNDKIDFLRDTYNFGRCTMEFMISIMNQFVFYSKRKQLTWLIKERVIDYFIHIYKEEIERKQSLSPHFAANWKDLSMGTLLFKYTLYSLLIKYKKYSIKKAVPWPCICLIRRYNEEMVEQQKEIKYQMLFTRMYDKIASVYCHNNDCKISYFKHVFGSEYKDLKEYEKNDDGMVIISKQKKWYKCKGCAMVYYCSRICQKIDWNGKKNNVYKHSEFCKKWNKMTKIKYCNQSPRTFLSINY